MHMDRLEGTSPEGRQVKAYTNQQTQSREFQLHEEPHTTLLWFDLFKTVPI